MLENDSAPESNMKDKGLREIGWKDGMEMIEAKVSIEDDTWPGWG